MALPTPQSTTRMSPFSPYVGRDNFTEGLESNMGTMPSWENDGDMQFSLASTGMTPSFARLQPEVTPSDLDHQPAQSSLDLFPNSSIKSDFPRVSFKDKFNSAFQESQDELDSNGKSPKEVATPFGTSPQSEAAENRTVVTGSGRKRTLHNIEHDDIEGK
jgi:hypothetical protein